NAGAQSGSGAASGARDIMPADESAARDAAGRFEDSAALRAGWSAAAANVGSGSRKTSNRAAAAKPPFPRADADVRGVRRFDPNIKAHANAWTAERRLALRVQRLPDEVVIHWGSPIGSHGADIVSVNLKTGEVTLWDSKFRGKRVRIQESSTFKMG